MKRITLTFDYNNEDDMDNDMIADVMEDEFFKYGIEGTTNVTVADIRDYNIPGDVENCSKWNYGVDEDQYID